MSSGELHDRLHRLKKHIVGSSSSRQTGTALPSRYARLAEKLGGRIVTAASGSYCLVSTLIEWGTMCGSVRLQDSGTGAVALSTFSADESEGDVRRSDLLFFDTETTGLGGAGAVAFLVGCGNHVRDGFEIRQYLVPDYCDEAAMLEELRSEFRLNRTLVSYNGAAFDATLLRDRMIVNRVGRTLSCAGHIDLLFPARRLFRRRLGSCRLIDIEQQLFSHYRTDDIPGFLIPSVYFDWLNCDATDGLVAVLTHNRQDIVSMYILLEHLAAIFASEGKELGEPDDIYSLSRIYVGVGTSELPRCLRIPTHRAPPPTYACTGQCRSNEPAESRRRSLSGKHWLFPMERKSITPM